MRGVTPTTTLRYLNRMLGVLVQELEIDEDEMMEVVFQESLFTFSKFFPYRYKIALNKDFVISEKYPNVYAIPNDDKIQILGVHRIWLTNMNQFGGSLLPLVNNPFMSQLLNDQLSMTITPTTFEFQAPNMLTLRPKLINNNAALVELKTVHPKHLRTVPDDMRDEFLKLCLYDVLLSLYPLRHRFSSLSTPYGSLEPFLEMVDSAESNRNDLLDK